MRARLLLALLIGLLLAPAAHARTTSDKIFADYTKRGQLNPCDYTTAELQNALDHVTPDIRQYASDYPDAIKTAISRRAGGACATPDSGGAPPPAAPPAVTPTAAPTSQPTAAPTGTAAADRPIAEPPAPAQPAPLPQEPGAGPAVERVAAAAPDNGLPAPLVGLGVLAVLLALTAALMLSLRRYGFGEGRLAPAYHSWREARWRAGGVWEDFRDWLRLGR
jgi:hypothetical protein